MNIYQLFISTLDTKIKTKCLAYMKMVDYKFKILKEKYEKCDDKDFNKIVTSFNDIPKIESFTQ